MKPLSESLTELAAQVKRFEESSAAAREKGQATMQARREELHATAQREAHEFEKTAADLRESAQQWWTDTREALEHQIHSMRADFEKWQTEIKAQRAAANQPAADAQPVTPGTQN
ncbi:hypothetical protein ACFV4K_15810 [Nocardia sp. NPDC059764]|uniref:hypothetical protein n=1 Tax=Nocardia sp. NPDC059764 TaxID=3346939 RepID=UPI00366749F3